MRRKFGKKNNFYFLAIRRHFSTSACNDFLWFRRMRPLRPVVQQPKLKGDFNLFIDSTHTHILFLVSRTHLLILILTSLFLAQNDTIKRKKNGSNTNPQRSHCRLEWFPVVVSVYALSCSQACTLFMDKVPVCYEPSTFWSPSQTLRTQKVPKVCSWNWILVREHC